MIDATAVLAGTFVPESMEEAVEGSVIIARAEVKLTHSKETVFGFLLIRARTVLSEIRVLAEKGWNEEKPWYEFASDIFADEAARAVAAGEIGGATKKELSTFSTYVRVLKKAMSLDAPLDEIDENGNYPLSGKTAIQNWNTAQEAEKEETGSADSAEIRKRLAEQGTHLGPAPNSGKEAEAETGESGTVLDLLSPKLRGAVEEYIHELADLEAAGNGEAINIVNKGIGVVSGRLAKLKASVQQAATGTDG